MKKNSCGIAAVVLIFTLMLCSFTDYYAACRRVRSDVLRLHITANSDSEVDQSVKLKVRDALLNSGAEIFNGSVTVEDARERLEPHLGELEKTADRVLRENGLDYTARACIVNEYFETREYDDIVLPAGEYTALRVALGTGEGKNWWCVMFPPLCLPAVSADRQDAAAVFGVDGIKVVKAESGFKVKFKIVELAEKMMEKIRK